MKLRNLNEEIAIYELRKEISEVLAESISDYLATSLAQLKHEKDVDLDRLAEIVAGLKVLAKPEHRETMTKDDIGINPNSFKELFDLLKSVPKDGKNPPKLVNDVFTALKAVAPSLHKKTREELEVLKSGEKAERDQMINKLTAFFTKANQLFMKLKTRATAAPETASATA